MVIQHYLIVHFINVVAAQDQHIIGIELLHICHVLVDSVCSSCIPFRIRLLLVWRKNGYAPNILIEIPRNTDADMSIQAKRLVLRQYTYGINS